jgi:5-hydroxyisourate hydrolase
MSPITSHVLDTALGRPAPKVGVQLERQESAQIWQILASSMTNQDGRVTDLLPEGALVPGCYRLVFDTAAYYQAAGQPVFYPEVSIVFEVESAAEHYHIPLLLSPFGYSTYRGS